MQGIARHLALDTHRGAPAPVTVPEEPAAAEEDAEDFDDLVGGWIRARIETLPEPHGEALRLFELERLPQAEIAAQLGVSAGTVKTRIHRGRAAVRDDLLACCDVELDADGQTHLLIDAAQTGVGGDNSWGARAKPEFTLRPNRDHRLAFWIAPTTTAGDVLQLRQAERKR